MPTTFTRLYLGTRATAMDPTEGSTVAENASLLVGQTYETAGDPLDNHATSATMVNVGGASTALDSNNNAANDTFTTNIGAGTRSFVHDISVIYNVTVTYADGTTAAITGVIVQSTTGELFLAPEISANADPAVEDAKPILSITLNSESSYSGNLGIGRLVTGFDNGWVDGTRAVIRFLATAAATRWRSASAMTF